MSKISECEYCQKVFGNNSILRQHQKTAKYCLAIQGNTDDGLFSCEYCDKKLCTNDRLHTHYNSCKEKQKVDLSKDIKTENEYLKQMLKEKDEYIKNVIRERDEYILKLEARIEKFEDAVISSKSHTTTTNNTTHNNNIIVTNNSLNLNDKEAINKIINEKLSQTYVCNGQQGLAKFAYDNILTDENGNLKYVCVDASRQNFEYTNDIGNVERDVKATKLKQALINSNVIQQAGTVGKNVWTKADGSVDNVRFEAFNGKVLEIMSVDKDDSKFRIELSKLTSP